MTQGGNPNNSMTSTGQHGQHGSYSNKEGMVKGDPRGTMTSIPHDYNQTTRSQEAAKGHGFFKRLFFHYDIREIEAELQSMKISKSDFVESTYAMSELGFFDLFFRLIPTISTGITSIFLAIIIYLMIAPFSVVLGIIGSLFFLQITVFQVARIVYSLDRHKVGEKETGRFIKIVRTAWHFYEFILGSVTIALVLVYFSHVDWQQLANEILSYQFKMGFLEKMWAVVVSKPYFISFVTQFETIFNGLLLLFLLFLLSYSVVNYLVYNKYKQTYKDNLFSMQKEFKNPADLAREKFDF
ncbi:hypothetical protein [Sulfurimonas indica]|uniref:hypothetical protein n=1 Tax=Sulfurimonas TaxID=202746 RepID=UPI001262E9B3|nr:hypothetical protein [Sulfurimonas indica]